MVTVTAPQPLGWDRGQGELQACLRHLLLCIVVSPSTGTLRAWQNGTGVNVHLRMKFYTARAEKAPSFIYRFPQDTFLAGFPPGKSPQGLRTQLWSELLILILEVPRHTSLLSRTSPSMAFQLSFWQRCFFFFLFCKRHGRRGPAYHCSVVRWLTVAII